LVLLSLVGWRALAWLTGWRGEQTPQTRENRRLVVNGLAVAVAVAAALIGFGTASTVYDTARYGLGLMPFIGAIAGLPFAFITTRPLFGLLISDGSAFVLTVALQSRHAGAWPWLVIHGLVIFSLLFATCARERLGRALGAWLITGSLFAWGLAADIRVGWLVGVSSVAVMGILAGRLASTRRALSREEQVSSAEKARRVVLEERARIARDLHDIVAHHMSLVVVQAETATYRIPDLTDSAAAEFLSIGEAARSALTETRALLSVLRQEGQQAQDAPQPGLHQLAELVEGAQRAGVRLEAWVGGDLDLLRPGPSLAAYRIVQEALANASRHARGAPVRIEVAAATAGVRLLVVNGPAPQGHGPERPGRGREGQGGGDGEGHGITGMRERAASAGGQLTLGPTDDGGFVVELILPTSGEEQGAKSASGDAVRDVDPPSRPSLAAGEGVG
jgi:signal transduction histidine kinase